MSASTSRLAGMFDADPTPAEGAPVVQVQPDPKARPTRQRSAAKTPARRAEAPPTGQPVGRPKTGKRSNPEFRTFGFKLRDETMIDVADRLRRRREYPDASELVQALLEAYLKKA